MWQRYISKLILLIYDTNLLFKILSCEPIAYISQKENTIKSGIINKSMLLKINLKIVNNIHIVNVK